jgi:SAM-dependent methyltransferase
MEQSAAGISSMHDILELAMAFQRSRVLLTASELDLFSVLGTERRSAVEVARAIGADPRGTDRLMHALCTLGLLEKQGDRFANTAAAARFLVRGAPEYMGGLMHAVHLWDSWGTLTPAVRMGGSVLGAPVGERGEAWLSAFIAAMHWRGQQHARTIVGRLDVSGVSRMLDVGGGSGVYAMAFAQAKAGLSAVVLDLPQVIALTQRYIRAEGLEERVTTRGGDYLVGDLGEGYDLVFLSAILHSNSPAENQALIRKAAAALNPGGQLVVQDFIVDEDRTGPPFAVLFALNMLVGTAAGDTYTESEVRGWMAAAGLSRMTRTNTDVGTTLIVGRK